MSSRHYFEFISQVFDLIPEEDKNRMGELWQGYEQLFASAYQLFAERRLNVAIGDLLPYDTERWLKYNFNDTNKVLKAAVFTATQDLSVGVNLSTKYFLKFSYDGGTPLEIDLRGINPSHTTIEEIKTRINSVAGFTLVRGVFLNTVLQFSSPTKGPLSRIEFFPPSDPSRSCSEAVLGLLTEALPDTYPKYPFPFAIPYEKVVDIPELRDRVRDESVTLNMQSGADYQVDTTGVISFKSQPPSTLWAKRTLMNNETPWNNFGFLMDIYQPNSPSYVKVVQGLWFAFWNGPRPAYIRSALYLLFDLPVAQEATTVTSVTTNAITTVSSAGITRVFVIPSGLFAEVVEGQELVQFQPLVTGIVVFDKINDPGFIVSEVGRAGIQRFLTESATRGTGDTDETRALKMLEEHTFLPQIDVEAFIKPDINLANVKSFLSSIQPLSKTFLFQVIIGAFRDPIGMHDQISMTIGIDVTPNLDSNQTTWTDSATLTTYETSDNAAMNVDSDGALLKDEVEVDVRSFGILIDSFVA